MDRIKTLCIIILGCLCVLGMQAAPSLPDSVLDEDHIYKYLYTDRAKSEQIMAEMRRREMLPAWELDYVEGDLNYNIGRNRQALKYYNAALGSAHVQDNDTLRMELLHRQISCYDGLHDEVNKMRCIEQLVALAKKSGNKPMESIALFNMGKSLYYQGDKERGYKYMEQGAGMMAAIDYRLKYDNLRYEYKTLVMFYERDGLYDDVLRVLEEWENVVSASTGSETHIDGLEESELKDLYAMRTVALSQAGRNAEAAESYQQFCRLDKNLSRNNYLIMPYLFDTKQYDEIFRIDLPRERYLKEQGDTVNYYMASILKFLGYAYRDKGDYNKSSSYFERLAVLRDSLKNREQESAAQEYAALYETHEKDLRIREEQQKNQEAQERNRRSRMIIFIVGALLVITGGFAAVIVRKNKSINRRNLALAQQIKENRIENRELDRKNRENLALRDELERTIAELRVIRGLPEAKADNPGESGEDAPAMNDYDRILFERIINEIKSRHLFRSPDFSRTELLKIIPVPQNKFAELFKRYAGMPFTTYLRNLRLGYATELFIEHPDWTMDAIIKECGMQRSAFYSAFTKKFGMNPNELRKNLQSNSGEQCEL